MRCVRCGNKLRGQRALRDRPDPLEGALSPAVICRKVDQDLARSPLPAPENTRAANAQLAHFGLKIVRGTVKILYPTDIGQPIPPQVTDRNLIRNWGSPVGLFSGVSKMPGKAFSIPAGGFKSGGRCHIADVKDEQLAEILGLGSGGAGDSDEDKKAQITSICKGCYALQGQYLQGSAQRAQWQRLMWIERTFRRNGPQGAGRALAIAIRWLARDPKRKGGGFRRSRAAVEGAHFFRLHDSGAVYSPAYANTWLAAACYLYSAAPPVINIWVPVRIWAVALRQAKKEGGGPALARRHPTLAPLVKMNQLPNVTIRPSALGWGGTATSDQDEFGLGALAPAFPGLSAGSGTWVKGREVPPGHEFCSAPSQAGRCFGDLPDAKPRPPWRLVGEEAGFEIYEKTRSRARRGSPVGKVETRRRWMGGGHRCTSCWNPSTFVLYGEHGEGAGSGKDPELSDKTVARMVQIRSLVQEYRNPKEETVADVAIGPEPELHSIRGRGRKNRSSWLVMDPRTSSVFARLYTAREARRLALRADLLVVHDGSGQIFDPASRRCVGAVTS